MNDAFIQLIMATVGRLLRNRLMTISCGLGAGYQRRFGAGYRPQFGLTPEDRFLMNLDYRGQVVYDVGGYIGITSMFFAGRVGDEGQVVTFEPNPRNFTELEFHLRINDVENVRALMCAVGDRTGRVELHLDPIYPARCSVKRHADSTQERIDVQIARLDDLVKDSPLPPPDFVKIDAEGLEFEVIKGMRTILDHHFPNLFIEIHGLLGEDLVRTLTDHGYSIFHVESQQIIHGATDSKIANGHLYCSPAAGVEDQA